MKNSKWLQWRSEEEADAGKTFRAATSHYSDLLLKWTFLDVPLFFYRHLRCGMLVVDKHIAESENPLVIWLPQKEEKSVQNNLSQFTW